MDYKIHIDVEGNALQLITCIAVIGTITYGSYKIITGVYKATGYN